MPVTFPDPLAVTSVIEREEITRGGVYLSAVWVSILLDQFVRRVVEKRLKTEHSILFKPTHDGTDRINSQIT